MTDREAAVKRYELDRLAEKLSDYQEQALQDNKEIKALLVETNRSTKELVAEIKKDYVSNDKLELRLKDYEPVRKFFWWVAAAVGLMFLATVYQLFMNGVKTL
ncbi:MAG: hypothetical protein WA972_05620 [Rhodococcus qingshengii]